METDNDYLQCLGVGLQGLRASGQFCDAMVCVGSTRILVHKVVLSAASKTLHDLALEFDMTPHRDRDQLEIVIPPDISLYAVNMFINYLYTGQVELREAMVGHMERLARQFGVARLLRHCQEFTQRLSAPDSQNLNLQDERHPIEPDSSSTTAALLARAGDDDSNLEPNLTRSSSSCSGFSSDATSGVHSVPVKIEPTQHTQKPRPRPGICIGGKPKSLQRAHQSTASPAVPQKTEQNFDELEKLMSPVVNLQKLPLNITPDVVVIVSDDETEAEECGAPFRIKPAHKYSLEEKEAVAIEAKRYGTTHVSQTRNIPLPDVLSWMTLFGLRGPGTQKTVKPGKGKQVNHEADISIVRWIVQQQELNGCVDLNHMKQYALTVYRQTMPKFTASITWLGNFLQRNMSVLQGTKFVHGEEVSQPTSDSSVSVKKELMSVEDLAEMNRTSGSETDNLIGALGENSVLEGVSLNEQMMVNAALGEGHDYSDDDAGFAGGEDYEETPGPAVEQAQNYQIAGAQVDHIRAIGAVQTPFGKRPIIVGQAKSFDAKSERKIVQWVLERNARDGYVFTDDFKDFARSLYTGSKTFGGTQAWMKKFIRRNRAIKDVKFCSKYKNMYTNEEKLSAVAMARRFGSGYAAKNMGISHKLIHCWRLAMDRGQLSPSPAVLNRLMATPGSGTPLPESSDSGRGGPLPGGSGSAGGGMLRQALHGIVPEFEEQIIAEMKAHQAQEGSISYEEISKISQAIYKETRPTFKASYAWIRSFLERHKEATKGIDIENISKVLVESEPAASISSEKISQMVDNALKELGDGVDLPPTDTAGPGEAGSGKPADRRPIIVGPSVSFDRKTEKLLVDWAIDKQSRDGYVFTDDFKAYAKSLHKGSKRFSASSGWMSLFLRRHRNLQHVNWRSKFKNNYTEEEKINAVAEARRLGTGHVGRTLGIDPALICAWRIKFEKAAQKQTFWKGTKIKKFGKASKLHQPKFLPIKSSLVSQQGDASRGIVPEFEQQIVALILEEHQKEGSISYEEISSISQSIYKETRPTFKASYAWIRNFLKRHEAEMANLNIDNVKKVFMPEDEEQDSSNVQGGCVGSGEGGSSFQFQKRPIILGQSRSLDTKTEKKLVQWLVVQQEKNGYVFLDQFKAFAQSLYKGNKKFAATQAWRVKFLRRNHAAVKHIKFTSSFRNQYSLEEKKAIVLEANRLGSAYVAKQTGIDQTLITSWRNKLKRSGELPEDLPTPSAGQAGQNTWTAKLLGEVQNKAKAQKLTAKEVGPGLYSHRGIVPKFEKKIVVMINTHMDNEGSVSYQDVSNIARAVYKETRPHFKASYNWIKAFIRRHKKGLRHVQFEQNGKHNLNSENGTEILIPEDTIEDMEMYMPGETSVDSWESYEEADTVGGANNHQIVIDNAEQPDLEPSSYTDTGQGSSKQPDYTNIVKMASKKPIIIGKAKHFDRKTEKKLVEWLVQTQQAQGFVFTDDFRAYARSRYTGPPGKFAATNAWFSKFLRRNKLANNIKFESKLKGNNPAIEEQIVQLVLEQQQKEGSVSNDDIQKITQAAYKEIRPNFRACYNWIRDFIKRHKEELAEVELENVKKVFIPDDDNERDGVLVRDYDPMRSLQLMDTSAEYRGQEDAGGYTDEGMGDTSWMDLDSSHNPSMSDTSFSEPQASSSVLSNLANKKRPIIVAPPKVMDIKTEKKLVQWMLGQQAEHGCVYLDLFKDYAKSIHTGPKKFAATQAWMVKFKQRNHTALKNVVMKSRFRNEYSMEEKMAAVEEARRLGCNHVGRKLGINGGIIYNWKVQLEQAEKLGGVQGYGPNTDVSSARGMVPEFEEKIVELVLETQAAKNGVSYDDIRQLAISVYAETRPNFKASNNWVMEFIRKNKERFEHVNFENQRKFNTEEEKLHILSEEKKYGTEHVTKKRNISASTIYQWKRNMMAKSIPIPTYKTMVGNKIKQKYTKGKKIYKTHTEAEKRSVVKVAEENGVTYASLKLGISKNMIAKWVRYFRDGGENIVINYKHASTLKKDLEQKVVGWVLEQNDELGIVMTNRVQDYAKQVFQDAYTNFNVTDRWLDTFISTNAETFEKVRFREKGDTDLDISEEIKLKLARHAEKHGAIDTSSKTGLAPKNIYNWRRILRLKGYDLSCDSPSHTVEIEREVSEEPKSLMQKKLEKIEQKYSIDARKALVLEANSAGPSATGSAHKIPLPLLLQWMKKYPEGEEQDVKPDISLPGPRTSYFNKCASSKESTPDSGSSGSFKVKVPSVEKAKAAFTPSSGARYTEEFKREICLEAKQFGVLETALKRGVSKNSIYAWTKNLTGVEDRRSIEKSRSSVESSRSSFDSDVEASTPIRVQNIKREPDTFSSMIEDTSYSDNIASIKRSYSQDEKQEVAKRAIEIGVKEASLEMDIPLSNVRRWSDAYKKNMLQSGSYEKKKEKKQQFKLSSLLKRPSSTFGDASEESGNDSAASFSKSSDKTSGTGVKRKSDVAGAGPVTGVKQRKIYKIYTDDEKYDFVLQSDAIGSRAAADKAGVSIDVLYKWRQKFGSRPKLAKTLCPSSSRANKGASAPETCTPSSAMTDALQTSFPGDGAASESTDFVIENVCEDSDDNMEVVHVENDVSLSGFQDDDDPSITSFQDSVLMNDSNLDSINDISTSSEEAIKDQEESLMQSNFDGMSEMQPILLMEKSAASKVLEMTTDYIEAEKEHEMSQFGAGSSSFGMNKTIDLSEEPDQGKADEGTPLGMIQILDVKSQAPD